MPSHCDCSSEPENLWKIESRIVSSNSGSGKAFTDQTWPGTRKTDSLRPDSCTHRGNMPENAVSGAFRRTCAQRNRLPPLISRFLQKQRHLQLFIACYRPLRKTIAMTTESPENAGLTAATVPNTVALIGVILLTVAIALCVLLFVLANRLPNGVEEIRQLKSTGPAQLQLLILLCSTAVLTLVAFLLCAVGLFLPDRPRLLASIGTSISLIMLLGVFGVLAVGTLMNPQIPPTPLETAPSNITPS